MLNIAGFEHSRMTTWLEYHKIFGYSKMIKYIVIGKGLCIYLNERFSLNFNFQYILIFIFSINCKYDCNRQSFYIR